MYHDIEGAQASASSETTSFNKYEVARQLFEGRITAISEQTKQSSAYDVLLAKGIEGGLAKEHVYVDPATGELLQAVPVGMLNRNSFMYMVNNFVKDNGVDAVQFAMFDIGGVRQMDIQGAADYNLNRIALKIKEVCDRYKHLPLLESRYGGDEFAVAVLGKLTSEQQKEFDTFQHVLQNELATIMWNRRQDEESNIVDSITSTCEKSETFGSPIGDTLYAGYLQRGVVLPKGEVNKMLMLVLEVRNNENLSWSL